MIVMKVIVAIKLSSDRKPVHTYSPGATPINKKNNKIV